IRVGARRLGPGAAIEPPAGSAGRIRHELPVHLARPGGGALHGGRSDGDERRRGGGDGRAGRAVRRPQAPVHAPTALRHSGTLAMRLAVLMLAWLAAPAAWAAHAYAQFGDIKYP